MLRPDLPVEGTVDERHALVETDTLRALGGAGTVRGARYRLAIAEGGVHHVDLRSYDFDAYLVLRDGQGRVLAEDDDGLIGVHARVVVELEPGADVVVEACALADGRGRFELRLARGEPPPLTPRQRLEAELDDARLRIAAVEARHGPDHPAVADELDALGERLQVQVDPALAKPLHERALAIRRALDPASASVALSLSNLAHAHLALGEYGPAREGFEEALRLGEAALGPDALALTPILSGLANLHRTTGDLPRARGLYERTLRIRERELGAAHPEVATTLNNLANVHLADGDLPTARALYERALASYEAVLGPSNVDVASCLNNLALVREHMGEPQAALPLLERVLAIYEQELGPRHRFVSIALHNLALLHEGLGDLTAAEPLYERALAIAEETLGPAHPEVARIVDASGVLLTRRGEYGAARERLERGLALREAALGPAHPDVAVSLNNLATLLQIQGDVAGALPLLERSAAIARSALGPSHPWLATALDNTGAALSKLGRPAEARPLVEEALAIRQGVLGPAHPDVAASLVRLATLAMSGGDPAQARRLYERALAIREATPGGGHAEVAETLNGLANAEHALGEHAAAVRHYDRALAVYEAALGADHPSVAATLGNRAVLALTTDTAADAFPALARLASGRQARIDRTLATLDEAEAYFFLEQARWQLELLLSPAFVALDPRRCYEAALAWKGPVLRAVRMGRERLRAGLSEDDVARLEELGALQTRLSRALAGDSAAPAFASADLAALSERRRALERELLADFEPAALPSWEALRDALPAASALVDLVVHRVCVRREGLAGWTQPRCTAWITRPDSEQPLVVDLGPAAALESAVRDGLAEIAGRRGVAVADGGAPSRPAGRALAERLWLPLASHLTDVDTVFVSPDGVLAMLPFEVLPDGDDGFLVERFGFVSVTDPTLLAAPDRERAPRAGGLLALGDVDYMAAADVEPQPLRDELLAQSVPAADAAGGRRLAESARGTRKDVWESLAATGTEVRSVATRHELAHPDEPRTLLLGRNATEEALKAALPRAAVLHLATHGYFQSEGWAPPGSRAAPADRSTDVLPADLTGTPTADTVAGTLTAAGFTAGGLAPADDLVRVAQRLQGLHPGLLAGLVCAGVNRGLPAHRDDGYLTAEEISWLDLSGCELVVLSACDTGLGRPQAGEGLLGLRRAFLAAGARTVVSSLWSVRDDSTAELMDLFYRNLWQRGLGTHAALRAAQVELLARNRARHAGDPQPETWGAFVLDGDWR